MENEAYKWLSEWVSEGCRWVDGDDVNKDYIYPLTCFRFKYYNESLYGQYLGFYDDMRQLLADAEAGRKLREGDDG